MKSDGLQNARSIVKIQKLDIDDKEFYCSCKKVQLGFAAEQEVKMLLEKRALSNNNYNNSKISIAPISVFSGAASVDVGKTHSLDMMQLFINNDQMARQIRKDKRVWNGEFSNGDGKKLCYLMT